METQSAFMAAAAACVLLVAALLRRRDRAALRYAALTLLFGLWGLGRGADRLALFWGEPLEGLALVMGGPAALAFAAALPRRPYALTLLRPIVALATLAFLAALAATCNTHPAVRAATTAWGTVGVLGATAIVWAARDTGTRHAADPEEARLHYVALSHGFLVAGIVADVVLWKFDAPRIGVLFAGLLYLYVGYLHLVRIRVADLRQLLGNALALALMAGGIAGLFGGLRLWVGPRPDLFVFDALIASFVLLLFYPAVRGRLQIGIERWLVAGKVELERSLQPLAERLPQIFTLDELARELLATLEQTDRVTASAVFLREDPQVGFRPVASIGLPPRSRVNLIRDSVFTEELEKGDPLLAEELDKALSDTRTNEERQRLVRLRRLFRDLDAQLVLPLRAAGRLLGFWTLTESGSREPFSMSEVSLLRNIAEQAAVSVANSKTFERVRARDRLVALGEMAGGLAHELRNPLATIRGALAVMVGERGVEPDDPEHAELERVVREEIERLDRVLTLFLDYARPSVRRVKVDDPGAFVRASVEAVARRQATSRVELSLDIAPDLPAITADADQLETVIENATLNAYEALEGCGRLRVGVRLVEAGALAPNLEISFEDNGPGMDESTLERAFVPFFTTKDRGTGLGLPLCERLVRAQGGHIDVRSVQGEGTTIRIRLPAGPSEPAA